MHGSRRSIRLIDGPPRNEGMDALPHAASSRARASRSKRGEVSRDPRRSFDVGKRRTNLGRMLVNEKELMGDEQRRY